MLRWLCFFSFVFATVSGWTQTERLAPEVVSERYERLLREKPEAGVVLDRLWDLHSAQPDALFARYRAAMESGSLPDALALGHLLCKAGRAAEAAAVFKKAVALSPEDARAYAGLGEAFLLASRPAEAAAAFEEAGKRDARRLEEFRMRSGQAWLESGDVEKAAALWEQGKPDAALRGRLADVYLEKDLPERALPHLRFLTEHGNAEERIQAAQRLAEVQESLGDVEAAAEVLEKMLRQLGAGHWQRGEMQRELIRLFERNDRLDALQSRWEKEAAENPQDVAVLLRLADLCAERADAKGEAEWIRRAQILAPSRPELHARLAELAMARGDWEEAGEAFDALTAFPARKTHALFGRATVDVKTGNFDAARKRVAALPEEPGIRKRALAFFLENRLYADAEKLLRQAAPESDEDAMALARFLFSRKQDVDALEVLNAMVAAKREGRAAAHLRVAEILREEKHPALALHEVTQAISLDAGQFGYHILQAELRHELGQKELAAEAYRKAYALADPTRQVELDRRLFQILSERKPATSQQTDAPFENLIPQLMPQQTAELAPALMTEMDKIVADAEKGSAESLRAARWFWWLRDAPSALRHANAALAKDPAFVPARHFILEIARETRQEELFLAQLEQLLKLDTENRHRTLRRIAGFRLEKNEGDTAIEILQQLRAEMPADVDVLRDLALAQQQVGLWYEALNTWRDAHRLAPAARKREMLDPLLRAMERLGMHPGVMELLEDAMRGETDARVRNAMLKDLIAYGEKHQLSQWLREKLAMRLRAQPKDFFYQNAVATLLKQEGKSREALRLLARARYPEETEAQVLPQLVSEAETLGDFPLAIRFQRRQLRFANDPSAQLRLAHLQERAFDYTAAKETWGRIPRLYPRNLDALISAARFFENAGESERALALYRQAVTLAPEEANAQFALGCLAFALKKGEEAQEAFQAVLRLTSPAAIRLPPFETREKVVPRKKAKDSVSENDWARLEAIRLSAALMAREPVARKLFTLLWRKSNQPTEKLWALYYGRDGEGTFEIMREFLRKNPDNAELQHALVVFALDLGEFERLREWVEEDPARYGVLLTGLGQYLSAHKRRWKWDEVETLFPEDFRGTATLWNAAVLFAANGHLAEGFRLGERLFRAAPTGRPGYGVELAKWLIVLGRVDEAKAMLRTVIDGRAESFSQPYFQGIRDYHTLLTNAERKQFLEECRARFENDAAPLQGACALVLVNALQGERDEARRQVARLIALRPVEVDAYLYYDSRTPTAARYWQFLLFAGAQFQSWNMEWLTQFLWERALEESALIRLQGEGTISLVNDIRARLQALKLIMQPTALAQRSIRDERFQRLPEETLFSLSSYLEAHGAKLLALDTQRILTARSPLSVGFARRYLQLLGGLNVAEKMPQALQSLLEASPQEIDSVSLYPLAQFSVQSLLRADEVEKAEALSDAALRRAPEDFNYAALRLQSLARTESTEWRPLVDKVLESGTAEQKSAAVDVLISRGKKREAMLVLEKIFREKNHADLFVAQRLIPLQIENGGDAAQSILRLTENGLALHVPQFAERLTGQEKAAFMLMRQAREQLSAPAQVAWLQRRLVEFAKKHDADVFEQERHRLKDTEDTAQLLDYYQHFATPEEVEKDWRDGVNEAGVALLATRAEGVSRLLLDERLSEVELARAAHLLEEREAYEEAARFAQKLCERVPGNEHYFLQLARLYWKMERGEEYRAALGRVAVRRTFAPDILVSLAHFCVKLGDVAGAEAYFKLALDRVKRPGRGAVAISMAEFYLEQGNFAEARKALFEASRFHETHSPKVFVEYLKKSGRTENLSAECADLSLSEIMKERILREME